MQIVFLNTFEKVVEESAVVTAQLSICEEQGQWSIHWVEQDGMDEDGATEVWFEGTSWEEMLTAFRYGAAKMMGTGYRPVIDSMLENRGSGGNPQLTMLHCYGELYKKEDLFGELRSWRRNAAAQEKKSAYLVATNRMLWMISAFVPQTEEELLQIPGWGKNKLAAYGRDVLAFTTKAERGKGFPLDWVKDELDPESYKEWLYKQHENKYRNQMERQQEKKKLLGLLQKPYNLKQLEEEMSLSRRELLIRIEELEQEGYQADALVDLELSEVPAEEQQQIWDAMTLIGDRYLKPVIKQVYGETETSNESNHVNQLYERVRLMRIRFRRKVAEQAG
ncbi:HRDC domain-containing protein [Paenibacillus sp. HB172176]|uniref:HRDC domain-containing protein n=1 Tax=Paenibacillus sp. HB172176 TaxID=2493690 RepID=UPI00143B5971|nr:HRDC domain-containing protein [Paenibacillus sp. HB172176]